MLPEIQAYFDTTKAAHEAYDKDVNKANAANSDGSNYVLRDARVRSAAATRGLALLEAWELLKGSDDPLVAFIGKECGGHVQYAEKILPVLPAPLAELQKIATEADWCSDWDNFVRKARLAGVLEPLTIPEELAAIQEQLYHEYGMSGSDAREVRARVEKLIERAQQAAVNKIATGESA